MITPEGWQLMDMGWLRQMLFVQATRHYPMEKPDVVLAEIDKMLSAAPEYKGEKE